MFVLGNNKGVLSTGDNVHLLTDSRNKTYLGIIFRENSVLNVRYLLKSEFGTPTGNVYTNVAFQGYTVSIDPAIVAALTGTDHPEGAEIQWHGGPVATLIPAITNLNYVPLKNSAIDSVTLATINSAGSVTPPNPNATKKAFTAKANADGTITVTDIQVGDLIVIDGGTGVAATETTYTSATLKDATHTVAVTAKGITYYYDPATISVTTKIELLSAPVDFIKENPVLSGVIGIGIILLIVYVVVPLFKGEPVFNGMLESKPEKTAKIVSLKNKRRRMSLAA